MGNRKGTNKLAIRSTKHYTEN